MVSTTAIVGTYDGPNKKLAGLGVVACEGSLGLPGLGADRGRGFRDAVGFFLAGCFPFSPGMLDFLAFSQRVRLVRRERSWICGTERG